MNPNRISHVKSAGILAVNRNLVGSGGPAGHNNYAGKPVVNGYGNQSPLRAKKGGSAKPGVIFLVLINNSPAGTMGVMGFSFMRTRKRII
jgi:hypothetical protein